MSSDGTETKDMIEAICAFGFMCAVTVAVQAARVTKARVQEERSDLEHPEAAQIVMLFAEAERMSKAA